LYFARVSKSFMVKGEGPSSNVRATVFGLSQVTIKPSNMSMAVAIPANAVNRVEIRRSFMFKLREKVY